MNLGDLREVLDERSSADGPEARSHLTLSGVRHRLVLRRRRRRIAAAAAAVVAVLAVGAGSLAIAHSPGKGQTATINGFSTYAHGARVIAASPPMPKGASSLRLTFVPGPGDLVFFVHCSDGANSDGAKEYQLALNGISAMSGTGCGNVFDQTASNLRWSYGVQPGQSSSVTVTFPGGPPAGFAVAVGQKVDASQYVFPSRPAVLTPLETGPGDMQTADVNGVQYRTTQLVRSQPNNPNGKSDALFTVGEGAHLVLVAQTPGALIVKINGVVVAEKDWWDYAQAMIDGGTDRDWPVDTLPAVGRSASIEVSAERMTGDWAVAVQSPS